MPHTLVESPTRFESGEIRPPVAVARSMAAIYRRPVGEVLGHCGIQLPPLTPPGPMAPEEVPMGSRFARIATGLAKVELGRAVCRVV